MSEQQPIKSIKRQRHRNRGKSGGVAHSMLSAKKSNIPLPEQNGNRLLGIVEWGKDNMYPYFLNYLAKNNSIHGGIINAKVFYTTSGGLKYEGTDTLAWEAFYKNSKTNHKDKNADEVTADASLNLEKANLMCFKVFLNVTSKEKKIRKRKVNTNNCIASLR